MKSTLSALALTVVAATLSQVAHANLLTNGSLTGPIANAAVPSGWSVTNGSPDTMDQDHNVGITNVPFVAAPVGPSPDGGTWVGFGRADGLVESFAQTVSGLVIGNTYTLSWYGGNFGAIVGACPTYCGANAIEALIDGTSIGDGGLLTPDRNWFTQSLQFVASASSVDLEFRLRDNAASYLSIDGISLDGDTTPVPEPAVLGLLSLSLLGLAVARRR